jgi:uncharacterized membrane protein
MEKAMIRESLVNTNFGATDFRWRGHDVTRLEGFSDAVFAFAMTLLVVSLEVPHTFAQLINVMKGFPAFAICFVLLIQVWHAHYIFFRRYGLQDNLTIVLNAILLFVILFYIYPLKFLFTLVLNQIIGMESQAVFVEQGQPSQLMIIYGLGFVAVFAVFASMYYHAYRQRARLELNALEIMDTTGSILEYSLNAGVALLSILIVIAGGDGWVGWAGMSYFLLGPVQAVNGFITGKRRRKLREKTQVKQT